MQVVRVFRAWSGLEPPASDWVYLVECSAPGCDNAQVGDAPQRSRSALECF